jgi:hypothetical protein
VVPITNSCGLGRDSSVRQFLCCATGNRVNESCWKSRAMALIIANAKIVRDCRLVAQPQLASCRGVGAGLAAALAINFGISLNAHLCGLFLFPLRYVLAIICWSY